MILRKSVFNTFLVNVGLILIFWKPKIVTVINKRRHIHRQSGVYKLVIKPTPTIHFIL